MKGKGAPCKKAGNTKTNRPNIPYLAPVPVGVLHIVQKHEFAAQAICSK